MSLPWGVLTIVLLTLLWGSSFVVSKDVLAALPVALLAALRSGSAVLSLFWVKPRREALLPGFWLGLIATGGFAALLTGLTSTTASKAAFIFALNALSAPLISAWVFRNTVPRRAYAAASVALLGLAVMTLTGQRGISVGDGWCFIGALFFGFYIAYVGEVARKAAVLALVQTQYLVMAVVTGVWAWPHLSAMPALGGGVWLAVLYLGLVCTALPTVLQVWAQRVVPAHLTALLFTLEPVFAGLFAFALLGEKPGRLDGLGAALILAASLLYTLPLERTVPTGLAATVDE